MRSVALAFAIVLAAPAAAQATVLLSNITEPVRDTTLVDIDVWAAQSFVNDGTSSTLTSIRTIIGDQDGAPVVLAQLREGSASGALLTTFTLPSFLGAPSARTFLPTSAVTLDPGGIYAFVIGVSGGGSLGWSYAEGNAQTGTGAFDIYEYSFDQAASWSNFGGDNPYLMEVNVRSGVIPEPATWAMMLVGFGLAGAIVRSRRARLAAA